jgi:hypothetical protein
MAGRVAPCGSRIAMRPRAAVECQGVATPHRFIGPSLCCPGSCRSRRLVSPRRPLWGRRGSIPFFYQRPDQKLRTPTQCLFFQGDRGPIWTDAQYVLACDRVVVFYLLVESVQPIEEGRALCGVLLSREAALHACEPPTSDPESSRRKVVWQNDEALLQWLESL